MTVRKRRWFQSKKDWIRSLTDAEYAEFCDCSLSQAQELRTSLRWLEAEGKITQDDDGGWHLVKTG